MDHHITYDDPFSFKERKYENMYEAIKVAQFGVGSQKETELLASLECPKDLLIVVLTHDTDRLYIISHKGCEEVDGPMRTLIEGGMFPNITGNITPRFKLMRVDVPTILANSARMAEQMGVPTIKKDDDKAKEKNIDTNKNELKDEPKEEVKEVKSETRKKSSSTTMKKTTSSSAKTAEKKETKKVTSSAKKPSVAKTSKSSKSTTKTESKTSKSSSKKTTQKKETKKAAE